MAEDIMAYEDVELPAGGLGSEYIREGDYIQLHKLMSVAPGSDEQDVRSLLGEPYRIESMQSGQAWEYNIRLPLENDDVVVCQYGITFDPSGDVTETEWRRDVCDLVFSTWKKKAILSGAQVSAYPADVLFGFNRSELSPAGRHMLADTAVYLKASCCNPVVSLVGHSDRIGSEDYNQVLSIKRAEAVRNYLESDGNVEARFQIRGEGERRPLVDCVSDDGVSAELIQCLQPNRRVEIEVIGPLE